MTDILEKVLNGRDLEGTPKPYEMKTGIHYKYINIFLGQIPRYDDIINFIQDDSNDLKIQVLAMILLRGDLELFQKLWNYFNLGDYSYNDNFILKYVLLHAREKCLETVKFLIDNGCRVSIESLKFFYSNSVLITTETKIKITELLIEHGADIHIDDEFCFRMCYYHCCDKDLLNYFLGKNVNIHIMDDYAICAAAFHNNYVACKWLIQAGANINARGGFPLKCAVQIKDMDNILELLLDSGADTSLLDDTDLIKCCVYQNITTIKILLRHGYKIDIFNHPKTDPEKIKTREFVDLLEENGVDLKKFLIEILNGYLRDY